MALNPFFLQGTSSEQRLTQDLINEHLKIYGVEVTYIPRKYVNTTSIIEEVQSSKFDDNFAIEAYVNTYEGYGGQGDVLTKFGMSIRDEVTLTISKERFEDFIAPFMAGLDDGPGGNEEITLATRPREGDLVFFPLGSRLFEVKFVEHEDPFYQLGKNYVYQLKCELFEYEDEVIDTSIDAIDTVVQDDGYISTLKLVGVGRTAEVAASIGTGYVREIFLNNDGSGFTSPPIITFSDSPSNQPARGVGILTTRANITSIEKILMTSAGAGYNTPPIITISGGGGTGAAATCSIETVYNGVINFNVLDGGVGYGTEPSIAVTQPGAGTTAVGIASIGTAGSDQVIKSVYIGDPGRGYVSTPNVTVAGPPSLAGVGTFIFNEVIKGSRSGTEARVKSWDQDTNILLISNVGIGSTVSGFFTGELIVGQESNSSYSLASYNSDDANDKYNDGDEFEFNADQILDFTESNPFGNF
ncbi:MAG: hypothetical protein CMC69_01905 [Flavobacteriaceae bacterium]|nr:hypothetical protein [Flavobacteriaceae bacterium]